MMHIGAKLPSSGPGAHRVPLGDLARAAEESGFDSLWVSDHVVMPREVSSRYPFSSDGTMSWNPEEPWYDALVSMATAAAVTERVEIGVGVLIVPMRHPLVLAKQLASLDALSGGRVTLGAGVGWLAEEFQALDVPFDARGALLDETIDIMRESWKGSLMARDFGHYRVPVDVICQPTPAHSIPILIGGMSRVALRRAGQRGDGWFALQTADALDGSSLVAGIRVIEEEANRQGRPAPRRLVMRIPGSVRRVAEHLSALDSAGVTDVVVDVEWGGAGPRETVELLRSALI